MGVLHACLLLMHGMSAVLQQRTRCEVLCVLHAPLLNVQTLARVVGLFGISCGMARKGMYGFITVDNVLEGDDHTVLTVYPFKTSFVCMPSTAPKLLSPIGLNCYLVRCKIIQALCFWGLTLQTIPLHVSHNVCVTRSIY